MREDYTLLQEIGHGGFGVVWKAHCKSTDSYVAIKSIPIDKQFDRTKQEISAMKNLRHANIIQFLSEFECDGKVHIVMEYCEHGSLRDYIKTHGPLANRKAAYVLNQLVSAVDFIHRNNMMHRDLSTSNVLIHAIHGQTLTVKLADFGLATVMKDNGQAGTIVGTPGYIAPQVYGRNYTQTADVYSLGAILFYMLTGQSPPDSAERKPAERREKMLVEKNVSECARKLIEQLMNDNPRRRLSLAEVSTSEFMQNYCPRAQQRDYSSHDSGNYSSMNTASSNHQPRQRIATGIDRQRSASANRAHIDYHTPIIRSNYRTSIDDDIENRRPDDDRHRPIIVTSIGNKCNSLRVNSPCRHSVYLEDTCRRCGNRKIEICGGGGDLAQSSYDRRSKAGIVATPSLTSTGNDDDSPRQWPLNTRRLGYNVDLKKTGRYMIKSDGTIVVENINGRDFVDQIMIINPNGEHDSQQISVFKPIHDEIAINRVTDASVSLKIDSRRDYKSFHKMSIKSRKIYNRTVIFVQNVSARITKIQLNATNDSSTSAVMRDACARLMENGDFRVTFADGRLAIQKKGCNQLTAIDANNCPISLSECERLEFDLRRSDCLRLELAVKDFADIRYPFIMGGQRSKRCVGQQQSPTTTKRNNNYNR